MITGSNAYGEALPPHFQFTSTMAKTMEGMRAPNECYLYSKKVVGAFGLEGEKLWPATFGVNNKGGMDNDEFVLYLRTNIMPLYPNAALKKGQWMILKCNSRPGLMNIDLLAELRASGFICSQGCRTRLPFPKRQIRIMGRSRISMQRISMRWWRHV